MVDLTGLTDGTYRITPSFNVELYPDIEFTPEAVEVIITGAVSD